MANLPKSDWMSLKSAFDLVVRETQQTQNEINETICSALYDEKLLSRGRCSSFRDHPNQADLENYLWDNPEVDWLENSFRFPRNNNEQRKNSYHQVTDVQIRRTGYRGIEEWLGSGTSDLSDLKYVPPYIEFMLKAVSALNIDGSKRVSIIDIKYWIEENWDKELGEPSGNLLSQMATLIRRPEDRKGGNSK
jgi:hypothetical protein